MYMTYNNLLFILLYYSYRFQERWISSHHDAQ